LIPELGPAVAAIEAARARIPAQRSVLVAVSGIDGSGKGYVAERLVAALERTGRRAAAINVDGWLELPQTRFNPVNPAEHFYLNALRFEPMFAELVLPLRDRRSLRGEFDLATETATAYVRRPFAFDNLDVIVLEGIFLLKRALRAHYDLSLWVACSFATALARAIARAQEGLPPEATIAAYETVYFPAQRLELGLPGRLARRGFAHRIPRRLRGVADHAHAFGRGEVAHVDEPLGVDPRVDVRPRGDVHERGGRESREDSRQNSCAHPHPPRTIGEDCMRAGEC